MITVRSCNAYRTDNGCLYRVAQHCKIHVAARVCREGKRGPLKLRVYADEPGYIESKGEHKKARYTSNLIYKIKILYRNFQGDFAAVPCTQ